MPLKSIICAVGQLAHIYFLGELMHPNSPHNQAIAPQFA